MKLVVDSSVSLKWWLDDEDYTGEARLLLKSVISGAIELILPELWLYEVANGVVTAVKRNRIQAEEGALFIEEIQAIPFKQYPIALHLSAIYKNAAKYKHAIYDMVYVTIAEMEGIPFITGDQRLYAAVRNDKPLVRSLSGLPSFLAEQPHGIQDISDEE